MQEFIILAGLPGSGKSTLAGKIKAEPGGFVVSSDRMRLALNAGVYPRGDRDGDYAALEPLVRDLVKRAVTELLRAGHHVAIDATNLTRASRASWRDLARSASPGIRVTIWWCTGQWDSAARWSSERGHDPDEYRAIRRRLESLVEPPTTDEADEVRTFPEEIPRGTDTDPAVQK